MKLLKQVIAYLYLLNRFVADYWVFGWEVRISTINSVTSQCEFIRISDPWDLCFVSGRERLQCLILSD